MAADPKPSPEGAVGDTARMSPTERLDRARRFVLAMGELRATKPQRDFDRERTG